MKSLLLLILIPLTSFAGRGKPELIARLNDQGAWNAPDNTWCFSSEPVALNGAIYLGCMDIQGRLMVRWGQGRFEVIARAEEDRLFSSPTASFGKVSWYEFSEWGAQKALMYSDQLTVMDLKVLGPNASSIDHFIPHSRESWLARVKGDAPELWIYEKNKFVSFFNPGASYLFVPVVSEEGSIAVKSREIDYLESSPDRIWHYHQGVWKVVLEDSQANPESPWKTFRNQVSVDGHSVVVIAGDDKGEALLLISGGEVKEIARTGVDLKKIDHFSPKIKAGTLVFRGVDFQNRKAVYIYDEAGLRPLLTQGDTIQTDKGLAVIDYANQDAIFYGAPGIDLQGHVYQQATLMDAEDGRTLLGVGILKISKE